MRWRSYGVAAVLVTMVAAGTTLVALRGRCQAAGGTFDWTRATCDGARPIILQGDIHRV